MVYLVSLVRRILYTTTYIIAYTNQVYICTIIKKPIYLLSPAVCYPLPVRYIITDCGRDIAVTPRQKRNIPFSQRYWNYIADFHHTLRDQNPFKKKTKQLDIMRRERIERLDSTPSTVISPVNRNIIVDHFDVGGGPFAPNPDHDDLKESSVRSAGSRNGGGGNSFHFWFNVLLSVILFFLLIQAFGNEDAQRSRSPASLVVSSAVPEVVELSPETQQQRRQQEKELSSSENMKKMQQQQQRQQVLWPGCLPAGGPYPTRMRHMVAPPNGPVHIVCCNTTVGPLNIEVHPTWAPNGAMRFIDMVEKGFFSTRVGLFRAMKGFLVQFGVAGEIPMQQKFNAMGNLVDDPSWLPLGPTNREINGVKRFQKGYLAYAGAGNNTRGTQLIMSFEDSGHLAGGSPWEVPFAQLIGDNSLETLSKIYTGYGDQPNQGKIMNQGNAYLEREWPLLDYITQCEIVDTNVPWHFVPRR